MMEFHAVDSIRSYAHSFCTESPHLVKAGVTTAQECTISTVRYIQSHMRARPHLFLDVPRIYEVTTDMCKKTRPILFQPDVEDLNDVAAWFCAVHASELLCTGEVMSTGTQKERCVPLVAGFLHSELRLFGQVDRELEAAEAYLEVSHNNAVGWSTELSYFFSTLHIGQNPSLWGR